jgi:hypothetical protein
MLSSFSAQITIWIKIAIFVHFCVENILNTHDIGPRSVPTTTYKTEYDEVCSTSYEKQCKQVWRTVPDKQCSTVYEKQCHDVQQTTYETTYKESCKNVPTKVRENGLISKNSRIENYGKFLEKMAKSNKFQQMSKMATKI